MSSPGWASSQPGCAGPTPARRFLRLLRDPARVPGRDDSSGRCCGPWMTRAVESAQAPPAGDRDSAVPPPGARSGSTPAAEATGCRPGKGGAWEGGGSNTIGESIAKTRLKSIDFYDLFVITGIGRDPSFPVNDPVDPARRNAQPSCQPVSAEAHGFGKLFVQVSPGETGASLLRLARLMLAPQWWSTISRSQISPAFQRKQVRHCSLIRMLHCLQPSPRKPIGRRYP